MESQLKDHGFKSQSEFWLFDSQHLGSSHNLNQTVSPPVGKENPGWHPVPPHCGLVSTQSPSTEGSLAPSPLQAGYHPVPQHWGLVSTQSPNIVGWLPPSPPALRAGLWELLPWFVFTGKSGEQRCWIPRKLTDREEGRTSNTALGRQDSYLQSSGRSPDLQLCSSVEPTQWPSLTRESSGR